MVLSSRKISQWQFANVVSHCLVTHVNRDTHTLICARCLAWSHFDTSLCAGGFCVCLCVNVSVCMSVCQRPDGGPTSCLSTMPTPAAPLHHGSFFVFNTGSFSGLPAGHTLWHTVTCSHMILLRFLPCELGAFSDQTHTLHTALLCSLSTY